MGIFRFRLPDIGEGVAEAEIVQWHVKPGDRIFEDQNMVDVMTDKATVEMSSPVDGVVTAIHGEVGAQVPVGSVLVEIEVDGQEVTDISSVSPRRDPPLRAAPSTRRRANELGVRLEDVPGTGPEGRITPDDLERHVAGRAASEPAQGEGVRETPITGVRRRIAERMEESTRRIPHISYVEECDLTELEDLRTEMNAARREGEAKLTLLPFFIRALVRVLPDFPHLNAQYDDAAGMLREFAAVHVGIATQTPAGLVVPVVRHAETLDIRACAAEIARLGEAARNGTATRLQLTGSTITITSLGALGGIMTTPIINRPEVAIIGPNKLVERAVVDGSFIARRKIMNISSSFDHRIVDGHEAARFIQALKRLLEHPALLFVE